MPSQTLHKLSSSHSKYKETLEKLLEGTEIKINGDNLWDIQVVNSEVYERVLYEGNLGLGESYMDGWWKCHSIDQFVDKLSRANIYEKLKENSLFKNPSFKLFSFFDFLKYRLTNPQKLKKAFSIGKKHYDIGNELFYYMLDSRMVYSCGYWKNAKNLNEAQESKLELSCKKINLQDGLHILDVGCGFGSFLKYTAEKHEVFGLGVTVSKEQKKLADNLCENLPIEIKLQDYREVSGKFDRIISIGMFEHVGAKNYRIFMKKVHELLKDDGLFLLHTIGKNKPGPENQWINKYIFPNSHIPTISEISESFEGIFVLEDLHNFGADYDKTLMAWNKNFQKNWHKLNDRYDEKFKRMWEYYLLSCAGAFRARALQLWQIIFSKKGVPGGYESIR